MVAVAIGLLWWFRWGIGLRAVEIVDPVVRRWASGEVARLSDGAYELTASPIAVDTERRRVAVDTIVVVTNPTRLAARDAPLPSLTLRFLGCALEGIDLDRLAVRRGLRATHAGCDSVMVTAEVPAAVATADTGARGGFLTLQRDLDLGRDVPFIAVDRVAFPAVAVALGIAGRGGRRTAIAFDQLAVQLDSLHYDPDLPVAERRTLLSRNATVALDGFSGSREAANRLELSRFRADLASGTLSLDGLDYEPLPGALADSLGIQRLAVDSLRVRGIAWGAFLTAGDVRVGQIALHGGRLRLPPPAPARPAARQGEPVPAPAARRTAEAVLRAIGRTLALDTLAVRDLVLVEEAAGGRDSTLTRLGTLDVAGIRVGIGDAAWAGPVPIGPVRTTVRDVLRDGPDTRLALGHLALDLAAGTLRADSLRAGADGTDADWLRGRRWRADRVSGALDSLTLDGLDAPRWLRTGAVRAHAARLHGVDVDILTDKRLPAARRTARHRHPAAWFREVPPPLHLDSLVISGRLQYRERSPDAAATGTLRLEALRVDLARVHADPALADTVPMQVAASARLMGAGTLTVRADVPLGTDAFTLAWSGRLAPMPAPALNPFLVGITPVRLKEGRIRGISWEGTVTDGAMRGTIRPRWDSLFVDVAAGAGGGGGILGGIKRALTKFAANEFVLREANPPGPERAALDARLARRWTGRETLLQFLWGALRDALLPLVKR